MTVPALSNGQAVLLRIFVGESDRWQHSELYEVIVREAHQFGLAGATVIKGTLSYGVHRHFHIAKFVDLSNDLPVIIEIVESEEKIRAFLAQIDPILCAVGCLVTLEKIEIYKHMPQS